MNITAFHDLHRFLTDAQQNCSDIALGLRHMATTCPEPTSSYLRVFAQAVECTADKVEAATQQTRT